MNLCLPFAASALAIALCGCAGSRPAPAPAEAIAVLAPTQGSTVAGSLRLKAAPSGLVARAHVTGLAPNTEHGFHIHEKGDCSAPDAMSAGGHFNPTQQPHGAQSAAHHAGDMPSLKADAAGVADAEFTLTGGSFDGGAASVVGKAVIIHAQPDDYRTQPTGNSGARVACGVIAMAPMQ